MDKIKEFFYQSDKLQHILFSMLLVLVFTALLHINMFLKPAALIAGGLSMFCGIGKEVYDSITDGVSSWGDILADFIGTAITVTFLLIV